MKRDLTMLVVLFSLIPVLFASPVAAAQNQTAENLLMPVLLQGKFALVALTIRDVDPKSTLVNPHLYPNCDTGIRVIVPILSDNTLTCTDNPDVPIGDEPPPKP